eukprot:4785092-Pleurochrysis_carterae.AAC.1
MGMLAYVSRFGLGSGPNITCTTLYLTLIATARTRGLGTRLNVLFYNASGDNKNAEVVAFIAWLVLTDEFQDASFSVCSRGTHTRI